MRSTVCWFQRHLSHQTQLFCNLHTWTSPLSEYLSQETLIVFSCEKQVKPSPLHYKNSHNWEHSGTQTSHENILVLFSREQVGVPVIFVSRCVMGTSCWNIWQIGPSSWCVHRYLHQKEGLRGWVHWDIFEGFKNKRPKPLKRSDFSFSVFPSLCVSVYVCVSASPCMDSVGVSVRNIVCVCVCARVNMCIV